MNKNAPSSSSTECCKQGEVLALNGKYKAALHLFNQAIEKNPRNQEAYKFLGFSLVSLNRFSSAMAAFRRCLAIAPHRTYYHYYLGKTYHLMGQYQQAIGEYRKALNSPWPLASKKANNAVVYREMGVNYLAWNKPNEALWCYEKSISIGAYFGAPLQSRVTALRDNNVTPKMPRWANAEGARYRNGSF